MVVVKQIITVKKKVIDFEKNWILSYLILKVISTLNRLESVTSFSEFVKLFGAYGTQMVDLAHLTGDRQNVNQMNIER
jgi:hypothetical protein